jgi:hypothetical protein
VAAKIPREDLARFFDPRLFLSHVDAIFTRVFG